MEKNCHVERIDKEEIAGESEPQAELSLWVMGMGCINCANRVHNKLISHPAVIKAEVSHLTGKAELSYLPTKVRIEELIKLVAEAGDERHRYMALPA